MLAALYIFHIQGRPQALQKLTFHQFMKFWTKKSNPLSRFLKTSKSCKFQVQISVIMIHHFLISNVHRLFRLRTSFVRILFIFTSQKCDPPSWPGELQQIDLIVVAVRHYLCPTMNSFIYDIIYIIKYIISTKHTLLSSNKINIL